MYVNNLPRLVTWFWQRHDQDSNPQPLDCKSDAPNLILDKARKALQSELDEFEDEVDQRVDADDHLRYSAHL